MTDNSKYGSITHGQTQTDDSDIISQDSEDSGSFGDRSDRTRTRSTAQTISTMTDPENNLTNKFQELKEGLSLDKIRILKFESPNFEEEWENLTTRASKLVQFLLSSLQRMFSHDASLLIAICLLLFTANLGVSYYVAFFPQYARHNHNASSLEIGVVMSSIYVAVAIFNPLVGKLIDVTKWEPVNCLWVGFILCSFSVLGLTFVEQYPGHKFPHMFIAEAIVMRVIQGVGVAFVNVAAGIVTLRYLAAPTTADSGSMIQSVIALGYMSGPPVGGILYYYFKWKNTFFILLVAHIVVLVIAAFLFYIGERSAGDSEEEENSMQSYKELLYNPLVLFLLFNNVVGVTEFAFMHPTLGLHAQQQYNANALQIGILFLIRDVFYCIAIVAITIVQKVSGPFLILMCGHLVSSIGYFLLGPSSFLGLKFSVTLLIIGISLVGVGVAAPMASTLDSLLLVVPLRRKSEEEISLKSILKILFIILNSAFYTGSLIGTAAGGLFAFAFKSYEVAYTVFAILLIMQSLSVLGFAIYLNCKYDLDMIHSQKKED